MDGEDIALVTGAGGFIGSHLVERLISEGTRVRALVSYRGDGRVGWLAELQAALPKEAESTLEVIRGDVRDFGQMQDLMEGVSDVYNLAALIGIPYSFEAPNSYLQTNLLGTQNLLEAARRTGVRSFVQTSTSEVYGTAVSVPMSENHRIHPQSPYAASKVAADALALSYFHSYGMPVTILRPFNTYGPRQSPRAVIPTIIRQLLGNNGGEIQLGNLEARRDFTFVSDTVEGFIRTSKLINLSQGLVLNLGSGWDISVIELLQKCSQILERDFLVSQSSDRHRPGSSEVERLLSNNELARATLGWTPINSTKDVLDSKLKETIEWWKSNLDTHGGPFDAYHR